MTDEPDRGRRSFLGAAATALTAARLGILGDATSTSSRAGHSAEVSSVKWPDAFAPIKQLDAGLLNVGYAESGPANGTPVILLHGWPYDIHSYSDVAPLLAAKGYRVIVPYLRGYGTTRFLAGDTVRNGQPRR